MPKCKISAESFFEDSGRKFSKAWLALQTFTLALLILSVWGLELSGSDSPRVAGIAREMGVTSDYLIPRLNGENFLEYPSLGYWPIALSLIFSKRPPDLLAFLPIVLLGTGTVLITYLIGRKLAGDRIGLTAGFILATMSSFISYHRHSRVDPTLLFFVTLSLYGFIAGYQASPSPLPSPLEGEGWQGGKRVLFFALFHLGMAGAFLSKGIVGVAIPAATVAVFLITKKDFKAIGRLLLSPAILFFILPIFLWVGSVWYLEGLGIFKEIIRQSLFRFLSSSADHAKPFYYYFIPALLASMPWTVLLLVLVWPRWRHVSSRLPLSHSSLLWFALIWFLTGLIGLSIASAKRPLYLGPLYPSFALLAALGWDRLREIFPRVKSRELYGLFVIFLIYVVVYLLVVTPTEKKASLRPVFNALSGQRTNGRVYLVNPSEAIRGASFFYIGERVSVLNAQDLLQGRFEDRPGTTLVIDSLCDNAPLLSNLRSKGYRLLSQRKYRKSTEVCVYSNSP
jgi:4-amino-4-deoxy-L-arabinose transferase-like glycosyltransferase